MSEPRRWRDSADAPEGAREVLQAAARTRPMPPSARVRSAARIARLAAAPAAGAAISLASVAWAAGVGAAAGVVFVAGYTAVTPAPALPPPITQPAVTATAPAREVERGGTPEPEPLPTAQEPAPAPRPAIPAPRAPELDPAAPAGDVDGSDTLAREAALLEQARARLSTSPGEALATLDRHARSFPRGKLGMERELLTLEALRRLGRAAEARARAEALLSRVRGSIYEGRVRRALGDAP